MVDVPRGDFQSFAKTLQGTYSNWTTIPALYIEGEKLMGGCDIVMGLRPGWPELLRDGASRWAGSP